jgi:hypothetical protein
MTTTNQFMDIEPGYCYIDAEDFQLNPDIQLTDNDIHSFVGYHEP